MHNSSLDKHICGRVDCRCTWLARKATPRFRLKITKINDFARAVARATKVESGIPAEESGIPAISKLVFLGEKLRH